MHSALLLNSSSCSPIMSFPPPQLGYFFFWAWIALFICVSLASTLPPCTCELVKHHRQSILGTLLCIWLYQGFLWLICRSTGYILAAEIQEECNKGKNENKEHGKYRTGEMLSFLKTAKATNRMNNNTLEMKPKNAFLHTLSPFVKLVLKTSIWLLTRLDYYVAYK